MTTLPTIGLIGTGLLGSAIGERLLASGYDVCGFDVDPTRLAAFAAVGGTAANTAAEVVRRCDTILLSLPTSDIVLALTEQLAPAFRPGQTLIDTSTGEPSQMALIGSALAQQEVNYIEAMVAGSSAQVRAGAVALFVGGDQFAVSRATPLLNAVTPTHFHLGAVGAASRFKLVHNLLLGLHRAVLAEGLTFAESLGFDPAESLRILQQTPAASAVMATKGSRMTTREFTPQARLSQHHKDVRLILAEATAHNCRVPLSELHQTLLQEAEDRGFGMLDNSAIIEVFRSAETDPTAT